MLLQLLPNQGTHPHDSQVNDVIGPEKRRLRLEPPSARVDATFQRHADILVRNFRLSGGTTGTAYPGNTQHCSH
jgi:hypothetical protein